MSTITSVRVVDYPKGSVVVSYDVFVTGFARGELSSLDTHALARLWANHLVSDNDGAARLVFNDGSAEVYGADDPATGFMVTHAAGRDVWNLLADIAVQCGATILLSDGLVLIGSPDLRHELPDELSHDAVVISTGGEILALVEAS